MEKKYIIVSKKNGKPIDNKQYTKEEFKKKAYELMEQTGLDRDAMNDTFTYQEVAEGGVSTEENASGSPKATNDEFASEDNSDDYEFTDQNDTYQATVTDDADGWNKVLDDLKQIPPEIASLVESHKDNIAIDKGKKGGNVAMKKNAIRVLYLYNEFMKFYNTYCSPDGELPAPISAYLRTKETNFKLTDLWLGGVPRVISKKVRGEETMDAVKKDMSDIIEDMFEAFDDYYKSGEQSEIEEFYDEIKDFDEEIKNIHNCIKSLSVAGNTFARLLAEEDDEFNKACNGNPTSVAMSKYLMDIAVNKYHLTRIQMNYKDPDSKLGVLDWFSPEDKASANVRLSENIDDYLDLKHAKILDSDDDKKQLQEIVNAFKKGKKDQKTAQADINRLVIAARDKIVESLRLFFKFVGITKTDKMNKFTSGLKRLNEPEYQRNWRSLVNHYKESIEKKIEIFKNAHSNDMTKESLDECVNILTGLLKNADVMLKDVEEKNGTQLMAHSREISERIKEVQEKTAAAQKAFPKQ